jgi:nucleoside 2-deoxyribosyltransferase
MAAQQPNRATSMSKHLYISGPMSGLPEYNHAAFAEAARLLRRAGYQVTSPTDNGLPNSATWQQHMREDIKLMMDCDGLAILPGWQHSRGANAEINLAHALGMSVHGLIVWLAVVQEPKQTEAAPC